MGYIGKVPADVLIDPHVDSAAITDGTIITADIADDAVTSAKLAQNSVDSSELIDGSVDNSHLAGSIAINKTLLAGGTGLTLSTNTLNVDAAQTQITSVGTLTSLTVSDTNAFALIGRTSNHFVRIEGDGSSGYISSYNDGSASPLQFRTYTGSAYTNALQLSGANATFAGQVLVPDGSAGAPSISNTGDGNTGLYFNAADEISITLGGTQLWRYSGQQQGALQGANPGYPAYSFATDWNTGMYLESADTLAFSTGGTKRLNINSIGNVGIGKSSIDMAQTSRTALEIGAEGTFYSHSSSAQGNVTGFGHNYYYSSDGTPKFMRANEESATMEIYNGGFYFYSDSRTDQSADATVTPTSKLTVLASGNTTMTNNLHIDKPSGDSTCTVTFDAYNNGGNVEVQYFHNDGNNRLFLDLYDGGAESWKLYDADGLLFTVAQNATSITWASDSRLKKEVKTIPNALATINSLRGVNFKWNAVSKKKDTSTLRYGFIAQEVKEVDENLVETFTDDVELPNLGDIYGVNRENIIPILVESIKELSAEIESLKGN